MPAGGGGLSLERPQLAAKFALQIDEARHVCFGALQPPLGTFLAATELQHTRRLLDQRAPVFGTGSENLGDLALRHDDVLLPSDPGIVQQFLQVEKSARRPVERVFRFARSEQGASDSHLSRLGGQGPRLVVDDQGDECAAQRRPAISSREDDIFHALASQRAGPLSAEHPCDGVDDVRLAAAVGAHHHRDTRLEGERGGVRERFETGKCQGAKEHSSSKRGSRRLHLIIAVVVGHTPDDRREDVTAAVAASLACPAEDLEVGIEAT